MKKAFIAGIILALAVATSAFAWDGAGWDTGNTSSSGILSSGATIGETLGPETLTLTCAGVGLATPVGAWSCTGDTITRTASGSNLTLVIGPVVTVGTEYRSNVVYPTITAGTFSISVGGFAQGTVGTAATVVGYHPAGAVTAPTLTVVAASAGTITLSSLSVKAVAHEIVPTSGPVVIHKTFTNTTANEVGLQVTAHTNGTLAGDKVAQRTDLDGGSATTGRRLLYQGAADGVEKITFSSQGRGNFANLGLVPPATLTLTGSIDPTASTTLTGVGTFFLRELMVGDKITVSGETRTVTAIASDTSLTVDTATTDTANDASVDRYPVGLAITAADSSVGTDIFVNPAVKSSGNLMDLRVGGVSMLSVSSVGAVSSSAAVSGSTVQSGITAPGANGGFRSVAILTNAANAVYGYTGKPAIHSAGTDLEAFRSLPDLSNDHTGGNWISFSSPSLVNPDVNGATITKYHNKVGTGYNYAQHEASGLTVKSTAATITADVGSAQGGSPVTTYYAVISVCANAGDSVTLPAAEAGLTVVLLNLGAQSADIFPASGDAINEGTVDVAKALAADAQMSCFADDGTNWECRVAAAR